MEQKYSIGLIGAGMIGRSHLKGLQLDSRANIIWVCDVQENAARQAAQQFNIPHVTVDYQEVLADPQLDAVIIATPPFLHAEQFITALQAGKHVLIEKPLAVSPPEVQQMVAAEASHSSQVILEASCRHSRLQPKFDFVKNMIASGRLGKVYHIHHNHLVRGTFIEHNKNGAWGMDKKLAGGGPVIDWGEYDLSFHLGVLGDTPELHSVRSFTRGGLRDLSHLVAFSDIEQHGAAWMEFGDGLTYYYERGCGVHCETKNETRIYGTLGGLRFHYTSWESPTIEFFYADTEPRTETFDVDMSAHGPDDNSMLMRHFLDCLAGKARPMMTIARAARHMEILFQILA